MTNKPTPPKAPATRTPAQQAMQRAAQPDPSPIGISRAQSGPQPATMSDYLKEAFFFRWNLLFLVGGAAAAAMTPLAPVLLPLVAAGELTYLTGLVSIPKFRAAIDAKKYSERSPQTDALAAGAAPKVTLVKMLEGLPAEARTRFEQLHGRCVEMRGIAAGVRGSAGDQSAAEEIRTPGLDRLL